jgi:hypothetical protein
VEDDVVATGYVDMGQVQEGCHAAFKDSCSSVIERAGMVDGVDASCRRWIGAIGIPSDNPAGMRTAQRTNAG